MATITLRVEDQVKDDLDALARSRGITVTDLLRPLVEEAAGRPAERARGVHPAHLTAVERRTMSLLHEILGKLDPEDESYHRLRAEALDDGYTAEYAEEFLGMEPELTVRDCEFVQDILDMFRVLKASADKLGSGVVAGLGARRGAPGVPRLRRQRPARGQDAGLRPPPARDRPLDRPGRATSTSSTTAAIPTGGPCRPTGGCWRPTSPCSRPRQRAWVRPGPRTCSARMSWPRVAQGRDPPG